MRYMTSWRLEGIEEGRLEEAQRLTLRQLPLRISDVSELQEAHIRRLSLERLEDLGEALLDFTQPDDLDAWLTEHGGEERQEK